MHGQIIRIKYDKCALFLQRALLSTAFFQILIFPEGTDYCEKTVARSEIFAKEHNLQNLKFLLQPRTTGFNHLVKELQKRNL